MISKKHKVVLSHWCFISCHKIRVFIIFLKDVPLWCPIFQKLKFASNLAQLPDGGQRICSNIRAVKELLMENAAIKREEDESSKKDQEGF